MKLTKLTPIDGFCAETGGGVTILAVSELGIPVSTTQTITGAILGVGAVNRLRSVRWIVAGRILWAWIMTIPMSAFIAALCYAAAFTLTAWSPGPGVYLPAFVLIGLGLRGQITSGIMLTLEFAPPGRQPTYAGLVNTTLGIVDVTAPLLGAWLAERSFGLLFLVGAGLNLAAFAVFLVRVRDPRHLAATAQERPPL